MKFYRCACQQCRIRALQAPLMLITIGALFALDQMLNMWSFGQTWPVILIVLGLVKVFQRLASDAGHGTRRDAPFPPAQYPPAPYPPTSYPPMTDTGEQNNAS